MSTIIAPRHTAPRLEGQRHGPSPGHLLTGGLLILIGVLWLLEILDVADVPWDAAPAVCLLVVGAALVLTARSGAHGGLVALGILLTLTQTAIITADVPLRGGIGDRIIRPADVSALESPYRHMIGQQTIDLTRLVLPEGTTELEASVAIGQLKVQVPRDASIIVNGHVGVGELVVRGERWNGVNVNTNFENDIPGSRRFVRLKVRLGVGRIVVEQ